MLRINLNINIFCFSSEFVERGQHGKGGETINILKHYTDIQNDSKNGLMLVKAVLINHV